MAASAWRTWTFAKFRDGGHGLLGNFEGQARCCAAHATLHQFETQQLAGLDPQATPVRLRPRKDPLERA